MPSETTRRSDKAFFSGAPHFRLVICAKQWQLKLLEPMIYPPTWSGRDTAITPSKVQAVCPVESRLLRGPSSCAQNAVVTCVAVDTPPTYLLSSCFWLQEGRSRRGCAEAKGLGCQRVFCVSAQGAQRPECCSEMSYIWSLQSYDIWRPSQWTQSLH
jgi:hypothetical protein